MRIRSGDVRAVRNEALLLLYVDHLTVCTTTVVDVCLAGDGGGSIFISDSSGVYFTKVLDDHIVSDSL